MPIMAAGVERGVINKPVTRTLVMMSEMNVCIKFHETPIKSMRKRKKSEFDLQCKNVGISDL